MKAPDFMYERPETLADALALLGDAEREAQPLAGGQSLMPMMNFRLAAPEVLVDLNKLEELCGIERIEGGIRVGAMTRYATLMEDAQLLEHQPLLARALPFVAHPAIRNRGTIGGSVALADPAAEMPALLVALGATIGAASTDGTREIPAGDFFEGLYATALEPGELVTHIDLPDPAPGTRTGFYELARRHGDYAMAGVAIVAQGEGMDSLRVVFFAVSDKPVRAEGVEAALKGHAPGDADALKAAQAAIAELPFDGDLNATPETKRHLAGVVLKRALESLQ